MMRTIICALLLSAALAAPAHAMKEVTITSRVTGVPCVVTFDDPMLAIAWMRVVAGEMDPDLYMQLYKIIVPDLDADVNAQHIVDACMGAGL